MSSYVSFEWRHDRLADFGLGDGIAGLIIMNEIARRSKAGGAVCFFVIPAALTVYFISIYVGAAQGAEWALNNQTYVHMNSWFHYAKLYAALAGCIGFMGTKVPLGGPLQITWLQSISLCDCSNQYSDCGGI